MDFVDFDLNDIGDDLCTIAARMSGTGRFVSYRSGPGKYAHVELVIAPHPGVRCYRFEWDPLPDSLPLPFMRDACFDGVKAALLERLADGRRVALVHVTIVDGTYHERDTDAQAVRIAANMAVRDALSRATFVSI